MKHRNLPLIILIGIVCLAISACSSAPTRTAAAPSGKAAMERPAWVDKIPVMPGKVVGIGFADDTGKPGDDRQLAEKRAVMNLASQAEVVIKQSFTSLMSEMSAGKRQEAIQKTREDISSSTQMTLKGASISERWRDPSTGEYWALAVMNRDDLEKSLKQGIMGSQLSGVISDFQSKSAGTVKRVAVGNIVYQDLELPSAFSVYLRNYIEDALENNSTFTPTPWSEILDEMAEKEINFYGADTKNFEKQITRLTRADGIVSGNFWDEGNRIKVFLALYEVKTGKRMTLSSFYINSSAIPSKIALAPNEAGKMQNFVKSLKVTEAKSRSDLSVEVWVNKGNGGAYYKGEKMIVFFRANRDCYLKLLHISADNKITLIFPNQYDQDNFVRGGTTYSIGSPKDNFQFVISPPYGPEIIKAVASVEQFADLSASSFAGGFVSYGDARNENLNKIITRGLSVKPQAPAAASKIAESQTLFNVMEQTEMSW